MSLGQPAIEALNVVKRVYKINGTVNNVIDEFPGLFQGVGRLGGSYHIHLKEGSKPYAISTPRQVPIPLMGEVKKELQRMEQEGVISRVTEPTDWCVGMVVVPKQNSKVRICMDLTKLNKCVKREHLSCTSNSRTNLSTVSRSQSLHKILRKLKFLANTTFR